MSSYLVSSVVTSTDDDAISLVSRLAVESSIKGTCDVTALSRTERIHFGLRNIITNADSVDDEVAIMDILAVVATVVLQGKRMTCG